MEINIKKNGNTIGTVGWLGEAISNGSVTFEEYTSKDNCLCLGMMYEDNMTYLAGKDSFYGEKYITCWDYECGGFKLSIVLPWLTKAARNTLYSIADAWIAKRMKFEDEETLLAVDIILLGQGQESA